MSKVLQGSEEWKAEKVATITGTCGHELLSSPTTRKTLMAKVISEYVTAFKKSPPRMKVLERGLNAESAAISSYELLTDNKVTHSDSYIVSKKNALFAASPDGLVEPSGGIEIKRLDEHNHIKTMINGIEKQYINQIRWNVYITNAEWWDYVGYCETMPASMQCWIKRLYREELKIDEVDKIANKFLDDMITFLRQFGVSLI